MFWANTTCEYTGETPRWQPPSVRMEVQTSFDKQDRHQEVCLDVLGFHTWFKNRLVQFYLHLAKDQSKQQCMDLNCDKHDGRTSKHYDFSSSPIKHWEKILEVARVEITI